MLLHAGVAHLGMWGAQVAALLSSHTVVRCDLPGYGGTPVALGPDSCAAEAVLALLEELGVERFCLVAASYGGYVALQVASAVPDRVERLLLLDAAADLVEPDESPQEVWRPEQALLATGDLDGATDLMLDTWLGPDADDEHRRLLWDMQRRAYELQIAAGEQRGTRKPVSDGHHPGPSDSGRRASRPALLPRHCPCAGRRTPARRPGPASLGRTSPVAERPAETARLVAAALG